jgi:integrase
MSVSSSHGAESRRPVFTGNRRVPGLLERTLASGATVYEARLRLGGNVRRVRLAATTKTDAIAQLRTLQVDFERGEQHRSGVGLTLDELADDYLTHLRAPIGDTDPRRRRSPRTVAHYDEQLRLHVRPVLGRRLAAELTAADVRRLLDLLAAKRLAPSSRTGLLNILSGLLAYGVKQGAVERNVVRDLDRDDRPTAARLTEPRYLAREEVDRLLAAMGDTFRPAAATCAYAGLRLSEALGLRWQDVDLKAGTLSVTAQLGQDGERVPLKTAASAATVPMLPALVLELRAHRSRLSERSLARVQADALVFTTAHGRPHGRRNVLRAVYAAGHAAGLNGNDREPVGVHDLRHSFRRTQPLGWPDVARGGRSRTPREPARNRDRLRGPDRAGPRATRSEASAGVRWLSTRPFAATISVVGFKPMDLDASAVRQAGRRIVGIIPRSFSHERAQAYERDSAAGTINEHYPQLLERWRASTAAGELWQGPGDESFQGDEALWSLFVEHVRSWQTLEIGAGPFGYLAPCWWIERRAIIDPLVDFYRDEEIRIAGESWFSDEIATYNQVAEDVVEELVGTVDGCIVSRNALDHMEDPLGVMHNIGRYAAPGCYLLFWTDIWHLHGPNQGHRQITRSPDAFEALIVGLGFDVLKRSAPVREVGEAIEYGCLAVKRPC